MEQAEHRFCECGNHEPMQLRNGQFGRFYGCTRRSCRLTQPAAAPAAPAAQQHDPMAQAMQEWRITCNSLMVAYENRKAWHLRNDQHFPELGPPAMPPVPGASKGLAF
jgi:hypothetical protein